MSQTPMRFGFTWILQLVLALFVLLDGVAFLLLALGLDRDVVLRITGSSWDQITLALPGVANYITNLTLVVGVTLVGFALMIVATDITGYRKGESWAWLLSWYLPLYFLTAGIITYREGSNISLEGLTADVLFAFFVFAVVAQLVSYRLFFPKERAEQNLSPENSKQL